VGYYIGAGKDLSVQNYRLYDAYWQTLARAKKFFNDYVYNVSTMDPDDSLVTTGWCLADPGNEYVIYLKDGGATTLDLRGESGDFTVKWYDPRNGGLLQDGSVTTVSGGASRSLGSAPGSTSSDWVLLLQNSELRNGN